MSVEIVWSEIDSFGISGAIQEPSEATLVAEAAPSSPVGAYFHRYVANVGDTNAINCGFYITPESIDFNPSSESQFARLLSWTMGAASRTVYGIYTVQGTTQLVAFLNASGPDYLTDYSDQSQQHTYGQGLNADNKIPLRNAAGANSDQIHPLTNASGSSVELYVLINIPDSEPADEFNFNHVLYYEEQI